MSEEIEFLKDLKTRLDRDLAKSDLIELNDLIDKFGYTQKDIERIAVLCSNLSQKLKRIEGFAVEKLFLDDDVNPSPV